MSPFDLPTVITYSGLMACTMGLILFFLENTYPSHVVGVRYWAVAPLIAGLAVLSRVWLRSIAPDPVAIGAQNVCLIATAAFFLAGTCAFFGRPLPKAFLPAVLAVSIAAMLVFGSFEGGAVPRRLFARSVLIALYAAMAWVILRQPMTLAKRLTLGVVGTLLALLLVRTFAGYLVPGSDGVDSVSWIQVAYAVGFSSTDVLIPICAILLITERLREVLENAAMHDGLTGTLTRRAFYELAEHEHAGCQRRGAEVSVLMLDLDHFKTINDTHGHHVGDLVLQAFVRRTEEVLRKPYLLGRYGGEEFVLLLPQTDAEQARLIAQRILSSTQAPADLPTCHVSIGLATASPGLKPPMTLDQLIQQADAGLYRAKHLGRNRAETADS